MSYLKQSKMRKEGLEFKKGKTMEVCITDNKKITQDI